MHDTIAHDQTCSVQKLVPAAHHERGIRWVLLLTAAMMVIEIVAGYVTGSMALLADGWHMATHVGALGLASAAYAFSRKYAGHRAFAFGTGKVSALAGYTSSVVLGLIAVAMVVESVGRLLHPQTIDFASSLPVAVIGLLVNLASVWLLHPEDEHDHPHDDHDHHHHDDHHDHDPHDHDHTTGLRHGHAHDHNHRAAFFHVLADTFTSALAIAALLGGRYGGLLWLDAVSGLVGGVVILKWGVDLARHAASELLDLAPSLALEDEIRNALEEIDDVRVRDLHVWSVGGAATSCVATIISGTPREPDCYRGKLARFGLAHLTVEVQRCTHGHGVDAHASAGL